MSTIESPPAVVAEPRTAPGRAGVPLLGIVPEIARRGGILLALLDLWHEYGDVVQARLGRTTVVFFARPEAVQRILVDNRDNYARAAIAGRTMANVVGDGLVVSEGAHWRRQRHFMQGPLATSAIPRYAPAMVAAVHDLLADWDERVLRTGQPDVQLFDEMSALTLDVVGRTVFGFDMRADARDVGQTFAQILDYLSHHHYGLIPFFSWLPTPDNRRYNRNIRHLRVLLDHMIRARRADPDTYAFDTDLLSVMLRARDDWGEGMLERHLRDEVMSLYLAGHSTTSDLLAWVFYVLACWPETEAALHAELNAVLGDREPGLEDLERLPYTGLVIQEALRLYPPVPLLTRDARGADVVEGYRVPAGALVVLSPYVTQRHPDVWPEPDRFDPWRHGPGRAVGRHPYAMFAFGRGYHSCIGTGFAQQEVRLVVASIARRYRLSLIPGPPLEPSVTSTTTPKGLRMRLERRN
jgi:cytochrome P450